jgi:hypothetical protein
MARLMQGTGIVLEEKSFVAPFSVDARGTVHWDPFKLACQCIAWCTRCSFQASSTASYRSYVGSNVGKSSLLAPCIQLVVASAQVSTVVYAYVG